MIFKSVLTVVIVIQLVQGDGFEKIDELLLPVEGDIKINNDSDIASKSVINNNSSYNVNKAVYSDNDVAVDEWGIFNDLFEILLDSDDLFNTTIGESRGKGGGKGKKQGFLEKMMPMMVIPFMISTGMIPMMMVSLIGMLLKSAFIGKIGIILMLINMLRPRNSGGGVYSHNVNFRQDLAMEHYGYQGGEEYGAYVNRKRKKRKISNFPKW